MRRDSAGHSIPVGSYISAPNTVSLSVSSANFGPLTSGKCYRLWSSVDAFFQFGLDNTVAATTGSHPIKAGLDLLHFCDLNVFVAAIVASGTGTFYISEYDVNTL